MDAGSHEGHEEEVRSRPAAEGATYRVDWRTVRHDWPAWIALALDFAFGLWAWGRMPARVPVHWGISGEPNGWGPASEAALLPPAVAAGIYLLMLCVPLIDPRRRNYALFPETLRLFRLAIPLFLVVLHVPVVLAGLGRHADVGLVVRIALPLLFIVMGNSFPRLRFNYMMGIRCPWTLDSEAVWNATHRRAGRLWVAGGVVMLLAVFWPPAVGTWVMFAMIALLTIWPLVDAYRLSRRLRASG